MTTTTKRISRAAAIAFGVGLVLEFVAPYVPFEPRNPFLVGLWLGIFVGYIASFLAFFSPARATRN